MASIRPSSSDMRPPIPTARFLRPTAADGQRLLFRRPPPTGGRQRPTNQRLWVGGGLERVPTSSALRRPSSTLPLPKTQWAGLQAHSSSPPIGWHLPTDGQGRPTGGRLATDRRRWRRQPPKGSAQSGAGQWAEGRGGCGRWLGWMDGGGGGVCPGAGVAGLPPCTRSGNLTPAPSPALPPARQRPRPSHRRPNRPIDPYRRGP